MDLLLMEQNDIGVNTLEWQHDLTGVMLEGGRY